MLTEIWKDISEFNGKYQVSNLGHVRNTNNLNDNDGGVLHPGALYNGYYRVTLSNGENTKREYVHRLVAKAFIDNPNNYPQINHKDENRLNNNVDNLEWCTDKYNANYGNHNKHISESLLKGSSKIVQTDLLNNFVKTWDNLASIQNSGFDHSHVANCCKHVANSSKGYHWFYKQEYDVVSQDPDFVKQPVENQEVNDTVDSLNKEIWKDISGTGGKYQVYDMGRVKSVNMYSYGNVENLLNPTKTSRGYYNVDIYIDGKRKSKRLNRLVAEYFVDNPNGYTKVTFKDGNRDNNTAQNLEWADKVNTANINVRKGYGKHIMQKDLDGKHVKEWISSNEAHTVGGFTRSHIEECCKGKREKYRGFTWEYVE